VGNFDLEWVDLWISFMSWMHFHCRSVLGYVSWIELYNITSPLKSFDFGLGHT
jgi:hypothetical protein